MKVRRSRWGIWRSGLRWAASCSLVVLVSLAGWGVFSVNAEEAPASGGASTLIDGRELFVREWIPGDPRSVAGDGLGPVFNESSCVSCHNQGGTGGGGPASKNVDIISAFQNQHQQRFFAPTLPELIFRGMFGDIGRAPVVDADPAQAAKLAREQAKQELSRIHPGFASARSVVLHRFGTDEGYESWRSSMNGMGGVVFAAPAAFVETPSAEQKAVAVGAEQQQAIEARAAEEQQRFERRARAQQEMQNVKMNIQRAKFSGQSPSQVGNFALLQSQRNPTALFGVGLIDSISDEDLKAAAEKKHREFPEISGRVAKLKDGKIGRFGWKAQTASLEDFTLTACAVELGLNVPGHEQAGVPQRPDYKSPGLDLTAEECEALEGYLRDLPAPERRKPASAKEAEYLKAGEAHFAKAGCAACHAPQLGQVVAMYSDLLLHDMGNDLGDTGQYGVFVPNESEEDQIQDEQIESFADSRRQKEPTGDELKNTIGALRQEWRTPPLWGVRDSAPYLHDGRAATLEEAIALHGGEGAGSAQRYFELSSAERMQLIAFLKSLTAPSEMELVSAK